MGLDDQDKLWGDVPEAGGRGQKRTIDVLAPWDLPAAKLLRPGRRCTIDDAASFEELWQWMGHKTDHQSYRSEFCSQDPIIRGVAISRLAQGLSAICEYILRDDSDLKDLLKEQVYKTIRAEAQALQPKVAILNGAGLPSRAGKKTKSMQLGVEKLSSEKKRMGSRRRPPISRIGSELAANCEPL